MQLYLNIALLILSLAIVAIHVLSNLLRYRKLLNFINIALHILTIPPMLILGLRIEVPVLFFMLSFLLYLLLYFLLDRLLRRGGGEDNNDV